MNNTPVAGFALTGALYLAIVCVNVLAYLERSASTIQAAIATDASVVTGVFALQHNRKEKESISNSVSQDT